MGTAAIVSVVHVPDGAVSMSGSLMESSIDVRVVALACAVRVVVVSLSTQILALCPA